MDWLICFLGIVILVLAVLCIYHKWDALAARDALKMAAVDIGKGARRMAELENENTRLRAVLARQSVRGPDGKFHKRARLQSVIPSDN